jgi:hypothetical protein
MAEISVPYMNAYGNISKALEAIKKAAVPPAFTQDFLATKLNMPGGSPKPVIPFLKKSGFLAPDGSPTDLYKRFRNPAQSGAAAADALRIGYAPLYEFNEYVHALDDAGLKGVVVQATGAEDDSSKVQAIVGSFKALKTFADFDAVDSGVPEDTDSREPSSTGGAATDGLGGLRLGYTINLNLPATTDVAVFNAIFKSLREHLLS